MSRISTCFQLRGVTEANGMLKSCCCCVETIRFPLPTSRTACNLWFALVDIVTRTDHSCVILNSCLTWRFKLQLLPRMEEFWISVALKCTHTVRCAETSLEGTTVCCGLCLSWLHWFTEQYALAKTHSTHEKFCWFSTCKTMNIKCWGRCETQ